MFKLYNYRVYLYLFTFLTLLVNKAVCNCMHFQRSYPSARL